MKTPNHSLFCPSYPASSLRSECGDGNFKAQRNRPRSTSLGIWSQLSTKAPLPVAFLLQTLAFVATNKVLTAARSLKRITGKTSVAKTRSLRLKIFLLILRMSKSQLIFFVALRHSTLFGGSAFYQPFLQPRVFCRLAMPKSFLFGMYFSWITAFVCICVCFARRSLLIWMVAEARAESHRTLQNFFTISFSQYTHMLLSTCYCLQYASQLFMTPVCFMRYIGYCGLTSWNSKGYPCDLLFG